MRRRSKGNRMTMPFVVLLNVIVMFISIGALMSPWIHCEVLDARLGTFGFSVSPVEVAISLPRGCQRALTGGLGSVCRLMRSVNGQPLSSSVDAMCSLNHESVSSECNQFKRFNTGMNVAFGGTTLTLLSQMGFLILYCLNSYDATSPFGMYVDVLSVVNIMVQMFTLGGFLLLGSDGGRSFFQWLNIMSQQRATMALRPHRIPGQDIAGGFTLSLLGFLISCIVPCLVCTPAVRGSKRSKRKLKSEEYEYETEYDTEYDTEDDYDL
eukprot:GHVO01064084.1.p1 GENE.GHVO01064084.1~~GHVO01064084.1.p1  ORF type:complete len:267 (+),score=23.46 GHVO01064084.1:239-1039(+)